MNRDQWIAEDEERIGYCKETISELDNISSCDRKYWNHAKAEAEYAASLKTFLQAGIKLLKDGH